MKRTRLERAPLRWLGLANALSSAGFALAFVAMLLWIQGSTDTALVAWLLAVGADQVDGTVARWTDSINRFGALLDAQCDALIYGIAPATFIATRHEQPAVAAAGGLLAIAVVWRCAHQSESGVKDITVGVPACLIIFALVFAPGRIGPTLLGALATAGAILLFGPVHIERRSPLELALIPTAFLALGLLLWRLV